MILNAQDKIEDFNGVKNVCHYVKCHYAKCHYAKCHYAKCHYAKCHYSNCRGAIFGHEFDVSVSVTSLKIFLLF